jgi:hypothetical protein
MYWNLDGSMSGYNISVPAQTTTALPTPMGVEIWQEFIGKAFGLRWRRSAAVTARDVDVLVDGVCYDIETYGRLLNAEGSPGNVTIEGRAVVVEDLPDGFHVAVIVITSDPTNVKAILLHGYLVEDRVGYIAPTAVANPNAPVLLTTSAVAIPMGTAPDQLRWMGGLLLTNVDSAARTVLIKLSSVQMYEVYLAAAGAAGSSVVFDWPFPTVSPGTVTWQASATNAVWGSVIGGVL